MDGLNKRSFLLFLLVVAFALGTTLIRMNSPILPKLAVPTLTPTPEPPFTTYTPPKLPAKKLYRVVLVGDSMTHELGPHGGRLLDWLQAKFTGIGFIIDNYAYSTNVLTLPDFLNKETKTWDLTFPPILSRDYDVIIIESFGYNPLSDHPNDGLQIQTAVLEQTVKSLIRAKPESLIVFMATIAPNSTHYALKTQNLTQEARQTLVNERVSYIKNHIEFAKNHNIPLVNVYEKSRTPEGDGNLVYISQDDYIHPSNDGLELICDVITNYLYDQNLIPH